MSRLRTVRNVDGTLYGYRFDCPGCHDAHVIPTTGPNAWGFNGDVDRPTFTPSILVRRRHPKGYSNDNPAPVGYAGEVVEDVCHSFVTDGRIQLLGDCTHNANQTLDLPELAAE